MSASAIAETVVALCAVIGIFVFGLGGKGKQNALSALKDENASLRNQLADIRQESAVWRVRAEKSEKNEIYLKEIAQSKPDFKSLSDASTKLSVQLTTQHKQMLESFSKLTEEITGLAKVIATGDTNGK